MVSVQAEFTSWEVKQSTYSEDVSWITSTAGLLELYRLENREGRLTAQSGSPVRFCACTAVAAAEIVMRRAVVSCILGV